MNSYLKSLVVLWLLLLVTSCQTKQVEAPALLPFAAPPVAEISQISFPLSLEVSDLANKLNNEIDGVLYQDLDLVNDGRKVIVRKTGDLSLAFNGDQVEIEVPLDVWTELSLDRKILGFKTKKTKELDFLIKVHLTSSIAVSPSWKLLTDLKLKEIEWVRDPSVQVAFLKLNVKSLVADAIEASKERLLSKLNLVVKEQVDLFDVIDKVWSDLQRPLLINRDIFKVWLMLNPQSIAVGKPYSNQKLISFPMHLSLGLKSFIGEKPILDITQLPKQSSSKSNGYGFALSLVSHVPYERINEVIQNQLVGKVIESEDHTFEIADLQIFGSGTGLILKVAVIGSYSGTVFLSGKPTYDVEKNTLTFEKLEYDISTQEVLVGAADWMFHEDILNALKDNAGFHFADELKSLPKLIWTAIEKGRVGKKLDLNIPQMTIDPQQMVVGENGVWIKVTSEGKLGILLESI